MKKIRFIATIFWLLSSMVNYAQEEKVYAKKTALWRSNKISVCWENPTSENKHGRDLVRQAIKDTWERYSALEFTGWGSVADDPNADIRIYVEDDGPHTKGLGMEIKNKPKGMVLNFTFITWSQPCQKDKDFCIQAIAVHEFGHAIGFAHEQNRNDCTFQNCLNKEQGSNGDWYVTPCDLRSIMNYCNPHWNNDGFLSELDIQGLQYLYTASSNKASFYTGIQLVHTANQIAPIKGKKISHIFNVYVVGTDQQLAEIEKVEYHLHPTFNKPTMVSNDKENKFGIGLRVWGQFRLTADVYRKGKADPVTLERYLDFRGTGIRPPGEKDE